MTWLAEFLAKGPVLQTTIQDAANDAGMSWATVPERWQMDVGDACEETHEIGYSYVPPAE
jgi:hypothetical protein